MVATASDGHRMMDNVYTYDKVSNILALVNNVAVPQETPVSGEDRGRYGGGDRRKALKAIKNTLPKSDQKYVKVNSKGEIDRGLINSANSKSKNFGRLKELVNSDKVVTVSVAGQFTAKYKNGEVKTSEFGPIVMDPSFKNDHGGTGETGFLGVTLTPDSKAPKQSVDNDTHVTINAGLSDLGQAETISHELYGHGLLYTQGAPYLHIFLPGARDGNSKLVKTIKDATAETVKNMNTQ